MMVGEWFWSGLVDPARNSKPWNPLLAMSLPCLRKQKQQQAVPATPQQDKWNGRGWYAWRAILIDDRMPNPKSHGVPYLGSASAILAPQSTSLLPSASQTTASKCLSIERETTQNMHAYFYLEPIPPHSAPPPMMEHPEHAAGSMSQTKISAASLCVGSQACLQRDPLLSPGRGKAAERNPSGTTMEGPLAQTPECRLTTETGCPWGRRLWAGEERSKVFSKVDTPVWGEVTR